MKKKNYSLKFLKCHAGHDHKQVASIQPGNNSTGNEVPEQVRYDKSSSLFQRYKYSSVLLHVY